MKPIAFMIMLVMSGTAAGTEIYSYQDEISQLGRGFDTESQRTRGSCLDGSIEDGPANRQVQFRTYVEENSRDILDQESGSGSASVNLWVVGGKAKSEFILRNSETKQQTSVLWSIDYRGGSRIFTKRKVNYLGSVAASKGPVERRNACGDQFIGAAIVGAKVFLSAALVFTSEENYRYYKTKVSASAFGGLVKKSKTSIEEVRQIAKGAYFSVQFYQHGGNAFAAELIQASGPSVCKVEDIDKCLDKFQALYDYTFGKNGFQSSFGGETENLKPLYMIGYTYGDSGHIELDSTSGQYSDPGFAEISDKLYSTSRDIQSQMTILLAKLATASITEATDLQLSIEKLNQRFGRVKEVADLCRTTDLFEACKLQYLDVAK